MSLKKKAANLTPTTIEALAKNFNATTEATEKFQGLVYTIRKSLGLNASVKDKAVDKRWLEGLLGLLQLIEGVESSKNSKETQLAYQQKLLGIPNETRTGELFHFRENYKAFLRESTRDIPRDLDKFFDALEQAISLAI